LRQPDEFWWCILPANARWLAGRFFWRPGTIGVNLNRGAIQAHMFDSDGQYLFFLQAGENPIQYPRLTPTAHPCIDSMPVAKILWQAAPFAPMLNYIQQRIEQLQIGHTYIAALPRQTISDTLKLTFSDLHAVENTQNIEKVN
jgi:hypothetical protein